MSTVQICSQYREKVPIGTGFTHSYIGRKYKTIEQILSFYYLKA